MALISDVQPGDLITALRMNELIDAINDLKDRVADLEGESNRVVITDLVFTSPLRLGAHVEIQGRNFGYSHGDQRVRFDNVDITQFRTGSDDTHLLVSVPVFANFPDEGRDVTLFVGNGTTAATRILRVLPVDRPVSGNLVDVLWETVAPNPPLSQVGAAPQTLRLGYRLRSRLGTARTFTITPNFSRSELQNVEVRDENDAVITNGQIPLGALEERLFFVQVPNVPSGLTTGTNFTVTVTAVSGGVTGSDTRSFTIGTSVTPSDPNITLSVSDFNAVDDAGIPVPTDGSYDAVSDTIKLRQNRFGRMELEATFDVIGTYTVTLTPSGTVAGWTRTLESAGSFDIEQNDLDAHGGTATRAVTFTLQTAGATQSQLEVRVQRTGATADERLTFTLALM